MIVLKQGNETQEQYEERVKKLMEAAYGKQPSLADLLKAKKEDDQKR